MASMPIDPLMPKIEIQEKKFGSNVKKKKQMSPCKSATETVSFEWSHHSREGFVDRLKKLELHCMSL